MFGAGAVLNRETSHGAQMCSRNPTTASSVNLQDTQNSDWEQCKCMPCNVFKISEVAIVKSVTTVCYYHHRGHHALAGKYRTTCAALVKPSKATLQVMRAVNGYCDGYSTSCPMLWGSQEQAAPSESAFLWAVKVLIWGITTSPITWPVPQKLSEVLQKHHIDVHPSHCTRISCGL